MASSWKRPRPSVSRRSKSKRRERRKRFLARRRVKLARRKSQSLIRRARRKRLPWWEQSKMEFDAIRNPLPPEYAGHFEIAAVGKSLVISGSVEVPHTRQVRRISLVFPGRPSKVRPVVMADGPSTNRHRFGNFRPSPLCIWYRRDPASLQWSLRDGLVGLIDLVRLHLAKEAYFRATGSWPGPEVHLAPALRAGPDTEAKTSGPSKPRKYDTLAEARSTKLRKKRAREKCWCGEGKYSKCHGAIDRDHEMMLLGLADD